MKINLKFKEIELDYISFLAMAVVLAGFGFRVYGLNWDSAFMSHSDERNVLTSISHIRWNQWDPRFYVYGAFPVYVDAFFLWLIGLFTNIEYMALVPRFLSAVWGTLTIWLNYEIGKFLLGRIAGLYSATFLAFAVFPIQAAHYGTVESMLILLFSLTCYLSLKLWQHLEWKWYILTGVSAGLALGSKMSAVMIVAPPLVAHLLAYQPWRRAFTNGPVKKIASLLGIALLCSFLASPYNYLKFEELRKAMDYEGKVVIGEYTPSYTTAFYKTTPYLYQLRQLIQYGLGWPLGLAAVWGFFFITFYALFAWERKYLILLAWFVPYFLVVGSWQVKFIRYFVPLIPLFCVFGACFLEEIRKRLPHPNLKHIMIFVSVSIVCYSLLYSFAFASIYNEENTRLQATRWFVNNVPNGAKILTETPWDEPIPMGGIQSVAQKRFVMLSSLSKTGEEYDLSAVVMDRFKNNKITDDRKPHQLAPQIAQADYVTLASKRIYGGLMNFQQHYDVSANFYRLLFSGALGFELVQVFTNYPALGNWVLNDDLAEESFQTYDHPKILVFKKFKQLPSATIREMLRKPPPEVKRISRQDMLTMNTDKFKPIAVNYSRYEGADEIPPEMKGKSVNMLELNQPRDLDADLNYLYVSDFRNNRIIVTDHNLRTVRMWGYPGQGDGEFNDPCGLAVDSRGNVIVADTWNHRLQKFDAKGKHLWTVGNLYAPRAVEVDRQDNIYASVAGSCVIAKFSPDGKKMKEWGSRGANDGQMAEPVGIIISDKDEVFVCDTWNKRVQVFDTEGKFLRLFPVDAWPGDAFREPYIEVAKGGAILVSDPPSHRILKYSAKGEFVSELPRDYGGKELSYPMGLALLPDGTLFIADTMNLRIVKTKLESE